MTPLPRGPLDILTFIGPQGVAMFVILLLLYSVIFLVPCVIILNKAGYSGWWLLLLFIPPVNLIALWLFALSRWPNVKA